MSSAESSSPARPRVGLFVTCLVDLFRPSVGFASVKLLEDAGCIVEVPDAQTCCGQPAFNSGDRATTEALVRGLLDAFEGYDYVVAPSGSCAGMLRAHVPDLFENDPATAARAREFAGRCHELVSFLVDVMRVDKVTASLERTATYHDSCSGLRELKVKRQPRRLLAGVEKLTLVEMAEPEVCCGFGGTFCVKYPQVSTRMVENKVQDAAATGAELLLAGDLGCLMNMAGKLERQGSPIEVRHVAEVLAGDLSAPPIGRPAGT
ncbi:MAG TPA: (Fe-S)-binding protein [Geminicoccus sp.]|jgi:L-lactate dehydrogenase complex protein LldE|uniref:(Fe-S)-binding protein n=1 Tax=Geminicoccus sp. TaxID=2024832 RepID=UPI002E312077|nr:(Fe-S)-binding protein [Geminicoccus sp.]HEX2529409.1 (Fe-S)-binding protein [Geminicoccus sp.]